jgi:hypothetical protein
VAAAAAMISGLHLLGASRQTDAPRPARCLHAQV